MAALVYGLAGLVAIVTGFTFLAVGLRGGFGTDITIGFGALLIVIGLIAAARGLEVAPRNNR